MATNKITTISITSRDYERSHGREPRGRGSWAFEVDFWSADAKTTEGPTFTPSMTWSEAKRWIKKWAIENAPDGTCDIDIDALS